MSKQPWGSLSEPLGDQSSYVSAIQATLGADTSAVVKCLVDYSHYSFFCDVFAGLLCPQIPTYIFKCKKISEAGAQSLLLDISTLRSTLLQLQNVSVPQNSETCDDTVPENQPKKVRWATKDNLFFTV